MAVVLAEALPEPVCLDQPTKGRSLMNAVGIHEPVNLGNPHEFTMLELAEQIAELFGTPSSVRFCPLPEDDPTQRCPDISRAGFLLGWAPRIELREGLQRTIADFQRRLAKAPERGGQRATARRASERQGNGEGVMPSKLFQSDSPNLRT